MELLFTMAHWHGLAKLRMHNDLTLDLMDGLTASLGFKLRKFSQKTCPAFATRELRREYHARLRREYKKAASGRHRTTSDPAAVNVTDQVLPSSGASEHPSGQSQPLVQAPTSTKSRGSERRFKTLNLHSYKFHSYGDYPTIIRRYGTMDSYSTEVVGKALSGIGSRYSIISFFNRASWNIGHLKPDIPVRVAKVLLNSSLELSVVKPVFVAFMLAVRRRKGR
jgi:hypothetical protein